LPESLQVRDVRLINLSRSGRFWTDKWPVTPTLSLSPPSISSPSPPHHPVSHRHAHQRLRDEKRGQGRPLPGPRSGRLFPISSPPLAPVPGLKVESVRRPTPLIRVPLAPKPWQEYICHFDKYPGGRVVRPSFAQTSDFVDATGHSPGLRSPPLHLRTRSSSSIAGTVSSAVGTALTSTMRFVAHWPFGLRQRNMSLPVCARRLSLCALSPRRSAQPDDPANMGHNDATQT